MKRDQIQELKSKSKKSLQKELEDERRNLSELRFSLAVGKAKNVRRIQESKKKIARLKTFINQSKK